MLRRMLVVLLSVLLSVVALSAQSFRGTIQGTVTDSSGAAVPGAEVKITSPGTGLVRVVQTNAQGEYNVPELPVGSYDVTAVKAGFQTRIVRNVILSVSSTQRTDLELSAGQVKESVEVTAALPLIETSTNTMGGTIAGEQASELPVNGRDYTKLLVLVPGATGDPVGASDSPGSFGLFSENGNRGRSNNYLLDGTDMNDGYRNLPSINQGGVFGTPATVLPVDAIAEVPVMSGVEAEFGRNSGAIVNLVTKSGTNDIHGSAFGSFRDSAMDARNFFNTTDQPQNHFNNNQFGISAGGPVIKDRTFWFAAYEGQREHGGLPTPGTVPTVAGIAAATADLTAKGGTMSPVISQLLGKNPWGTLPASGDGSVQFNTPFSNRVDSVILKLDQHLGGQDQHDLLTGRYFFGDSSQSFPLGLVGGGGSAPGYNTTTPTRVNIVSVSYTHVFTPSLLTEFRGGYNRFHEDFFPLDRTFDPRTIGLNTLPANATSQDFGLPLIAISGFSSVGATPSVSRGRVDTNTQLFTNTSYTHGSHNWKFGYEFRRTFIDGFFDAGYRGKLSFADSTGGPGPDFTALENFLMGIPASGRSAAGDSRRNTFENNHGVYLQDNWRITTRLTLNYGLRWDYYGVIGEKKNQLSILNSAGSLVQVGTNGLDSLYPKDFNNFGPRIGLSYDLTGKGTTVLRAGWGIYYDAFSQDFFVGQLPFNTFNPGPAYNDIQFSFSPNPIVSNQPVFSGFGATDVFTVDQKLRTPYVQNYNLNLEHQLSPNMAVQVGYVGSAGRKLFRYRDINQVNPATGTQLFAAQGLVYVNQFESSASSHYDSLQTSFKIRAWHGLTSTLNYTWAHSIDNASDGQDYVPNATQPDNSFNPAAERASSNFDTRHRLQWYWTLALPKYNTASWITSGWALDGVTTFSTGQPYNVNFLFEGDYNGTGEFFGRPDLVGNPFTGTHGALNLLNLSAFAAPCQWDATTGDCAPGTAHIGNLGRNAFNGPNYTNFDFSLVKNNKLTERIAMQLRVDFFNLFNHPNFSSPLLPNFGVDFLQNGGTVATINGQQRLVGTAFLGSTATPDVGTGNPFLGGGGARNIQLGLRLSF